jgi:hypothetical protein
MLFYVFHFLCIFSGRQENCEKASTLCVGEINFGSFELLSTKNGLVVEVGSGMGTFFPVYLYWCPQPVLSLY